ncbi:MAG: nitrogenase component 1 [Deltaproteobacteria bacterium]|nr:nitrogenase component 1 [Deltaproteobacteria bacterium]
MKKNKERRFSQRLMSPYMVGLYLGVNAVRDFYLLIDGPDCSYMKTQYIALNHDLYSNLTNLSGFHRIGNTALHPVMMAGSREEKIFNLLKKIALQPFTGAIGISPMPMAAVTAVDYKRILRQVSKEYMKPLFEFANKSLSGDWMDGYSEFAKTIAKEINLSGRRKKRRSVGIVGYLYDRNEYDNYANISELKRIFGGIGVDVCSVWFSGGKFSELSDIARAELIISLGYADEAAHILSERLGIPLMKADYPVGFEESARMLYNTAEYFGIKNSSLFIEDEIKRIVRRIEPLVEHYFYGLDVVYAGDPILFNSLRKALELLGAKIALAIITNTSDKMRFINAKSENIIAEPSINDVFETGIKLVKSRKVDLYIGNSDMSTYFIGAGKAAVELGFPSYFSHCIYEEPYVGFSGFLSLTGRIIRELRYSEVRGVFGHI